MAFYILYEVYHHEPNVQSTPFEAVVLNTLQTYAQVSQASTEIGGLGAEETQFVPSSQQQQPLNQMLGVNFQPPV